MLNIYIVAKLNYLIITLTLPPFCHSFVFGTLFESGLLSNILI